MPTLTGTDGPDVLNANGPNGVIYSRIDGKAGDDIITAADQTLPSQGNDTIIGNGHTTILYWDSPSGIVFNFKTGMAQDGWGTVDHFTGVDEVMTTSFDDIVIGSDANESVMFAGGGNDTIDLGGGIDKVKISVTSDTSYSMTKQKDGSWLINYQSRDQPSNSVNLKGTELVQFYDPNWNLLSEWELFGDAPKKITSETRNNPSIHTELTKPSAFWSTDSKILYKLELNDQHAAGYYPKPTDTYPAGYNSIELLHNATFGEYDGKPGQDLLIYPVMFPHLLEHRPIAPILFVHTSKGLQISSEFSDAVLKGRQQDYRTQAVDFNGDGRLDSIASQGVTGDLFNKHIDSPILAVMSNVNGGWTDTTSKIAGQDGYSDHGVNMFGHDFAAGDINGDGRPDFLTGNFLFLNQGEGNFSNASALMGKAAALRLEKFAMSSLLTDINGDGYDDLVFWQADPLSTGYLLLNDNGRGFTNAAPRKLGEGVFGPTNTKFNHAIKADFNHDGSNEVVLGETRAVPYYQGRALEFLVSDGTTLINQTAQRLPTDPRKDVVNIDQNTGSGEGQLFIVDVNADGHLDIVDSGTRVLLNDGEGYFTEMPQDLIPRATSQMLSGWLARDSAPDLRLVPIDLDGKNGIDWVGEIIKPITSWPQNEPTVNFLYSITSSARYGKAGNGAEGAASGVPGFDENYYLRRHPEVVTAINDGKIKNALDHYLKIGKSLGYDAFAPYTIVWGSDQGDQISLQTGNETYHGGKASDNVAGLAGNDLFEGNGGDDYFDGGAGFDTAQFHGNLKDYSIVKTGNSYIIKAKLGDEGSDRVVNTEALTFADFSVDLTIQGMAASAPQDQVQSLIEHYIAFFNRLPDASGLEYWIGQMQKGLKLNQIADSFYSAGIAYSSLTGFSASMSNEAFINIVYKNVLGRIDGADIGGLTYWNSELSSGRATRGTLVSNILNAAHTFKGDKDWGWVANLLDNKIKVAKTVAIDWGLNYNSDDMAITKGMQVCAAITPTDITTALSLIGISSNDMILA
ncbi:DUF4214 domain-containing protein [Undibacterium sp. Di24W]|uniref:DUF4214 domain-containing protein n=1 Tax=Undibacterium sp. Di24W TaxID=3413033 RepID=UPI003BEF56A7